MFNPFTYDYMTQMKISEETQRIIMTSFLIYFPIGLITGLFLLLMTYVICQIFYYMIYGPKPSSRSHHIVRDPMTCFDHAKKMVDIQWEVDAAERGVHVPIGAPYKDDKKVIPTEKHDHYVSKVKYTHWSDVPSEKHWLERVDHSYFPFTLFEERFGKPETSFDYSFPKQSEKVNNTWYCFRKENRWFF